jgi:hypothetical protein
MSRDNGRKSPEARRERPGLARLTHCPDLDQYLAAGDRVTDGHEHCLDGA